MTPDNNPSRTGSGSRGSSDSSSGQVPRSSASRMPTQMNQQVRELGQQVSQKAEKAAEDTKGRVAEQVEALASAFRTATGELQQGKQTALADRVEQLGQKLQDASQFLRDKSPAEIKTEVEGFARRQPAWFLGGAFVVGLLSARFLKSSDQPGGRSWKGEGDRDSWGGSPSRNVDRSRSGVGYGAS